MEKYGRPPKNLKKTASTSKKSQNCPDCTMMDSKDIDPCKICYKNIDNYKKEGKK